MSRLKDLLIQFESDCEIAIEGAETVNEFKNNLIKISSRYESSFYLDNLNDMWDEFHGISGKYEY